ncbi:hypothetical protein SDC9_137065 [bioreactor metagenome]|uniref:Uncharacterized protein n=1 Tax=bioreactor metagenome TaxID=1076179 RepID=A0A645DKI7_9ZZZZ
MEEFNKQVYHLCDFYDGKDRRPKMTITSETVPVVADTYVIPGASNTENFGTNQALEVRYHTTEANRREAFLKFDLSAYKPLLPYLKNAELEVTCTSSNASLRSVFASGISDTSWEETTFNGSLRQSNADWKNGYNRLAFQKGVISTGKLKFDVTNWIYDQPDNTVVSFRIHDFTSTDLSVKIASGEFSDIDARPVLKLTFYDPNSTDVPTVDLNNRDLYNIYPNPVRDLLHIKGDGVALVELFSLKGERLLSTAHNSINVSGFENGIYLLKVLNTNGTSVFVKVNIIS